MVASGSGTGSSGNWNDGSVGVHAHSLGGRQLSLLSTRSEAVDDGMRRGVLALVGDRLLCGR
jgi:hypothetical protein